jgi:hypothetical protein
MQKQSDWKNPLSWYFLILFFNSKNLNNTLDININIIS